MARLNFAGLLLIAIVLSATAGALGVYYGVDSHSPQTSTQTVTLTSVNTVVQIVTSLPQSSPSLIAVQGTVESEDNYPVSVDFCRLSGTGGSNSSLPQLTGVTCGGLSASVTNQTTRISEQNRTFYYGVYTARLPNNATYLLQVRLNHARVGYLFEEQAGWLPLNYTGSSRIGNYGISCYDLIQNGTLTFECNSGFG